MEGCCRLWMQSGHAGGHHILCGAVDSQHVVQLNQLDLQTSHLVLLPEKASPIKKEGHMASHVTLPTRLLVGSAAIQQAGTCQKAYAFCAAGIMWTKSLEPFLKPTGTAHLPEGMSAYFANTPAALPRNTFSFSEKAFRAPEATADRPAITTRASLPLLASTQPKAAAAS